MSDDLKRKVSQASRPDFPPDDLWRLVEQAGFELSSAGYQKKLVPFQQVMAMSLALLSQLMEQGTK